MYGKVGIEWISTIILFQNMIEVYAKRLNKLLIFSYKKLLQYT